MLQNTVVIFDTDPERVRRLVTLLGSCAARDHFSVSPCKSLSDLRKMMSDGTLSVLLIDARCEIMGLNAVDFVRKEISPALGVQTVFVGVSENLLTRVQVESVSFAYLLPSEYTEGDLETALKRAFVIRERWLDKPFLVHTRKSDRAIIPSKVSYVESDRRKIRIHIGDEVVEAYGKLSELVSHLPYRFVQCHKSFLVNLGYVERFDREFVLLTTGEYVPVSQKRRKDTREAFFDYVGRSL